MNQCDKCGHKGPNVAIGDNCPKCGQLVGWPVPGANASAVDVDSYDPDGTDADLAVAIDAIAQRNLRTLLNRKIQAERAVGIFREAPDSGTAEVGNTPPNAEPVADPSVQPQPGGDDAEQDAETT